MSLSWKQFTEKPLNSSIWLLWFMVACVLLTLTPSPFMSLAVLLGLSVSLSMIMGHSLSSWLFMVVVLVYVGGVMIMFVYLTSLLSGAKIASYSPRLVSLVAIIAGASFNMNLSPVTPQAQQLWLYQGLDDSVGPLVCYSILYLLLALVIVFFITSKLDGPMKQ